MDNVALWAAGDRAALFSQTGAARGLANLVVEKDFWVCWTLKRVAGLQGKDTPDLVFKGGTSLSKAYGAIRRFSEDIDLSFDRKYFGYNGERDPMTAVSGKKADRLIENLTADIKNQIAVVFFPRLNDAISGKLGPAETAGWSLAIDNDDAQTIIFHYPASLVDADYSGLAYISRRVKLELGARGDPWPTKRREIKPYAAEEFPMFFQSPICSFDVLALSRTFWEKATLLHAEYHRDPNSATPRYLSRHYYDLAMLADGDGGKSAVNDIDLLAQVAKHKSVFFRSKWANYETARPGTLRLTPHPNRVASLRTDYKEMAPMIFDDPPPGFEHIIHRIELLEQAINGS